MLDPQKKLDERSRELTFVGYTPVGYRLWDLQKRKIVIAKDVKFEKINTTRTSKTELRRAGLTLIDEDEEQEQEYNNLEGQQEVEEDEEQEHEYNNSAG